MRVFSVVLAVAGLGLAACGYDPHPKDGKLPCTEGCPSGYECRCDDRCWRRQSAGGACARDAGDAQIADDRRDSAPAMLDGGADRGADVPLPGGPDAAVDTGHQVAMDVPGEAGSGVDGKTEVPHAVDGAIDVTITRDGAADAWTPADAPLPMPVCTADQSKLDECVLAP